MVEPEGFQIPNALKIVAGSCAFTSILISTVSIFLHFKNYRKPMDQRLVVRIQLLLPIFALSSWLGLISNWASGIMDTLRENYEAFVIYTFFTLLTNILGGERDIIISTSGRQPKSHLFPLNYFCGKVDISDPLTFLAIKRGILQYTWIKPLLSLATVIMQLTGTYNSNTIKLNSGYMWVGIIYNVSISVSLYSLALFWYCLLDDLAPYRPFPKFICVKIIIFFSYWQGFLLSILVYLGLIPEAGSSGSNNIARAIQNSLMCVEMLGFAVGHWYAFSYEDYATSSMIGFARLPVYYAIRDAFGIADLVIDFRSTFWGRSYGYRQFDSIDDVLSHPESRSRRARINAGLRYRSDGRSKYWLPRSTVDKYKSGGLLSREHLLAGGAGGDNDDDYQAHGSCGANNRGGYGSFGAPTDQDTSSSPHFEPVGPPSSSPGSPVRYVSDNQRHDLGHETGTVVESAMDPLTEQEMAFDDKLYAQAKQLKFGDYNYPVITVRESVPYQPVMEQQDAYGIGTTLQEEYDTYVGPESDDDEYHYFA